MGLHYDFNFFQDQSNGSFQSAMEMAPFIIELMNPSSIVDIGCGVGAWLSAFQTNGIDDILGIDGDYVNRSQLRIPEERFFPWDLTQPVKLDRAFDLAISLEVAEHLPESCGERFIANLVSLAPVILFSAAIPGQGGTNHINEQWPLYWHRQFAKFHYQPLDLIRSRYWDNGKIGSCYRQNAFLFVREDVLQNYPRLVEEANQAPKLPLKLVHPEVFQHVITRPITMRPLLRSFPGALRLAAHSRWARAN